MADVTAEEAIKLAQLWRAGKMIGGDGAKVRAALLSEVERQITVIADLKAALEYQWLLNHDERCTNMRDCASFGFHGEECREPRPAALSHVISNNNTTTSPPKNS